MRFRKGGGLMNKEKLLIWYEFYIYAKSGEQVWHWNIDQIDKVLTDIKENQKDNTFSVEVQRWFSDGESDLIEIFPNDDSQCLPKYIQKYTTNLLNKIKR